MLKLKKKTTSQTGDNGTRYVEIMVPLKYLSNVWENRKMTLVNCEISLDLKTKRFWSAS